MLCRIHRRTLTPTAVSSCVSGLRIPSVTLCVAIASPQQTSSSECDAEWGKRIRKMWRSTWICLESSPQLINSKVVDRVWVWTKAHISISGFSDGLIFSPCLFVVGMADFQCLAVHTAAGKDTSLYNKIILHKSENQAFFEQPMPYFLPPAIFSRLDTPVDYCYRPDSSCKSVTTMSHTCCKLLNWNLTSLFFLVIKKHNVQCNFCNSYCWTKHLIC